jgi:hypothetical protein
MKIGMMYFDNSNLPLSTKVRNAVNYYQNKYGAIPTMIMCNPKDYVECKANEISEFAISTSRSIRINHLWVGMSEEDNLLSELNTRRIK